MGITSLMQFPETRNWALIKFQQIIYELRLSNLSKIAPFNLPTKWKSRHIYLHHFQLFLNHITYTKSKKVEAILNFEITHNLIVQSRTKLKRNSRAHTYARCCFNTLNRIAYCGNLTMKIETNKKKKRLSRWLKMQFRMEDTMNEEIIDYRNNRQ